MARIQEVNRSKIEPMTKVQIDKERIYIHNNILIYSLEKRWKNKRRNICWSERREEECSTAALA